MLLASTCVLMVSVISVFKESLCHSGVISTSVLLFRYFNKFNCGNINYYCINLEFNLFSKASRSILHIYCIFVRRFSHLSSVNMDICAWMIVLCLCVICITALTSFLIPASCFSSIYYSLVTYILLNIGEL